jgi:hypothetical protein
MKFFTTVKSGGAPSLRPYPKQTPAEADTDRSRLRQKQKQKPNDFTNRHIFI